MNTKKFVIGSIVVWLFIFLYEWVVHGIIMADTYSQYAHLFRSEAAMKEMMWSMMFGQLLVAFGFCFIYTKGYQAKGICEGLRYGFYVCVAFAWGPTLITYPVYLYPGDLTLMWGVVYLIELLVCGLIVGAIYTPAEAKVVTD